MIGPWQYFEGLSYKKNLLKEGHAHLWPILYIWAKGKLFRSWEICHPMQLSFWNCMYRFFFQIFLPLHIFCNASFQLLNWNHVYTAPCGENKEKSSSAVFRGNFITTYNRGSPRTQIKRKKFSPAQPVVFI